MRRGVKLAIKMAVLLIVVFAVFTPGVFFLWNWLMPIIFGLHTITFWQALGLIGLSWLLFRGPMFARGGWAPGGRLRRRWAAMTPEQREQFRRGMRTRCGAAEPPVKSAPGV